MGLYFEWDEEIAERNSQKHGVSFEEAATIFGDRLSLTIGDPLHSVEEDRFITIGLSLRGRILVGIHTNQGNDIRIIGARLATNRERSMKKMNSVEADPAMLPKYDFGTGVRGKYAERYAAESNIVVLSVLVHKQLGPFVTASPVNHHSKREVIP